MSSSFGHSQQFQKYLQILQIFGTTQLFEEKTIQYFHLLSKKSQYFLPSPFLHTNDKQYTHRPSRIIFTGNSSYCCSAS